MRPGVLSAFAVVTPTTRRILVGNLVSAVGSGITLPFFIIYLGQVRGLGTPTAGLLLAYVAVVTVTRSGPCPGCGVHISKVAPRTNPASAVVVPEADAPGS